MMKALDKIIRSAITSVLSLSVIGNLVSPSNALAAEQQMEKCYGIVKAGMNDCPTSTNSCAKKSKVDNQPDAYILLPKGMCEKIAGGSLKPKTTAATK